MQQHARAGSLSSGRMKRILVVLAVVVGFVGLLWLFQRSLIYLPTAELGPLPPGVQEATFTTSDGLELGGWFFPAGGTDGRAVLVSSGKAGNRSHRGRLGGGPRGGGGGG